VLLVVDGLTNQLKVAMLDNCPTWSRGLKIGPIKDRYGSLEVNLEVNLEVSLATLLLMAIIALAQHQAIGPTSSVLVLYQYRGLSM
jgi:hypothetical protein